MDRSSCPDRHSPAHPSNPSAIPRHSQSDTPLEQPGLAHLASALEMPECPRWSGAGWAAHKCLFGCRHPTRSNLSNARLYEQDQASHWQVRPRPPVTLPPKSPRNSSGFPFANHDSTLKAHSAKAIGSTTVTPEENSMVTGRANDNEALTAGALSAHSRAAVGVWL